LIFKIGRIKGIFLRTKLSLTTLAPWMMPFKLPTLPGYFGLSWHHAQTTREQKIQIYNEEYSSSVPGAYSCNERIDVSHYL
jgi:hypothetical protein